MRSTRECVRRRERSSGTPWASASLTGQREKETKYIVKQRTEKSEENREHRGTEGKKVNGGTRPYEEPDDKDKGCCDTFVDHEAQYFGYSNVQ